MKKNFRYPLLAAILMALGSATTSALAWNETTATVAPPSQEFRAAWVATVYNIDWPSRAGLSVDAQKGEMNAIVQKAAELNLNALIVQVRPCSDALYNSSYDPWSQWLSGVSGKHPGYDPLAYMCQVAHAYGIEIHAWFNPFRALGNVSQSAASNHISRQRPDLIRRSGSQLWADPGHPDAADRAMKTIMEVVKKYDIDGIHLDDYFYPYPLPGKSWSTGEFDDSSTFKRFGSGSKTEWRRRNIDQFVKNLYSNVKGEKSWVRVGISPFGIWRPGVPNGIEAGIDAYEQLAADSRKWLANGWVDYLAPQLYWRCEPQKQSFPLLLQWWRAQSSSRPVFPGIASARIKSSEDPSRTSGEIVNQIQYTRKLHKSKSEYNGMIFWSMKSLMQNKDGINQKVKQLFTAPALPSAMPWCGSNPPGKPKIFAANRPEGLTLFWKANDTKARKWVVQARYGNKWKTLRILPAHADKVVLNLSGKPDALSVRGVCPYGSLGEPSVVTE